MDIISILIILAAVFVGWGIGANDAANAIGVIVGSRSLRYRIAVSLVAVFMLLGALLQGHGVIETVGAGIVPSKECTSDVECNPGAKYCNCMINYCNMQNENAPEPFICENKVTGVKVSYLETDKMATLAALSATAIFMALITFLKLPVSTSQAVIGALAGVGISLGVTDRMDMSILSRIIISWILTPLGAIIFALLLYRLLETSMIRIIISRFNRVFKMLLLLSLIFVSYSLGANNIGNAVGPLVAANITDNHNLLIFLVGLSMAVGALTSGKGVVKTVGTKITELDPVAAFTAQFSAGITLYIFTILGIPISSTQAMIGGVTGVGLTKGIRTVNSKLLVHIFIGWVATPISAAILSILIYKFLSTIPL